MSWVVAAPGCGTTRGDGDTLGSFGVAETSSTNGTADDGGDTDTEPEVFDVGAASDGGGSGDGCNKIDFLFVIDNSLSMADHQTALVSSFGPFMDTIFDTVQAQDYRIMVTDSDAGDDLRCDAQGLRRRRWNRRVRRLFEAKADLDLGCERRWAPARSHRTRLIGERRHLRGTRPRAAF